MRAEDYGKGLLSLRSKCPFVDGSDAASSWWMGHVHLKMWLVLMLLVALNIVLSGMCLFLVAL